MHIIQMMDFVPTGIARNGKKYAGCANLFPYPFIELHKSSLHSA
jgi:hypothetical protein